ncbi:MAG TPA: Stp1/IreP family PP2C-type Ser/Thr phosphatase [Thermoanaerobaculia bacterium]|nr:Stp1/IreP family PP2C-type Ser/Thr phosphatase [Thermoanaerobaculia bacterium]
MLRIKACGLSDVGLTRVHNEDYFEIDPRHRLYVVADGMGGHSYGEVAAQITVRAIHDFVEKSVDRDTTWPTRMDERLARHSNLLKMAVRKAHDNVLTAISKDGNLNGMGSTVVGVLVFGATAAVAHVGDSRAYRLRNGRLDQLTQDHTWVHEQVIAGLLSQEQARSHPLKNVVTRALGGESEVMVDVREVQIQAGDLYLLCSDGLTGMLSDVDIRERLESGRSLQEICRALVNDANARGGLDNVTVVLLSIEENDEGEEAAAE